MKKYDLHKIMKAAHEIYRKYFKLYQLTHGVQTFGDCLKLAWADEKKRVADEEASGKSSVSCPLKPSDSAPLKHSTMPP